MSRDEALQPPAPPIEQPARDTDVPHEPVADTVSEQDGWPIDRPFPAVLTPTQLTQIFGICPATYHNLRKLGRWRVFELRPPILGKNGRPLVRYSGALVREYVLGQGSAARTFGAKRGPRVA